MTRDVSRLASSFDVLIVGGGIYGLAIAYDAAQRGLKVALIDRSDFGSGASFNHLRTIHGGLRYLQGLDVARSRESVRERRTLAHIAPHAIRPLTFALPLVRSFTHGKLAFRAGFLLDRLVASDRNRDVPNPLRLPAGRVISRNATIRRFPSLDRQPLTGAAVWSDYQTAEADRLTFSYAIAAVEQGAVLANHVEATAPILEKRCVVGVKAVDRLNGRDLEIAARVTVNATGGDIDRLLEPSGLSTGMPLLTAMNLVTCREAGDAALGGRTASGRTLFLVPWRGRALFGTWESPHQAGPEASALHEADIASFILELNQAFPALDLRRQDVTLVHHGVVPAAVDGHGRVSLATHEQWRDHGETGVDGLVSIAGTKYTTARAVAERVTNRLIEKLRQNPIPCRTATTPLPGGDLRDVARAVATARGHEDSGWRADTIPHLMTAYGSRYRDILELAAERPEWRTPVADDSPVIGAQLAWAVRMEMAMTLCDAAVRRTPLGALGFPGDRAAEQAARIVGAELGWTAERMRDEIVRFKRFYDLSFDGRPLPRYLDIETRTASTGRSG